MATNERYPPAIISSAGIIIMAMEATKTGMAVWKRRSFRAFDLTAIQSIVAAAQPNGITDSSDTFTEVPARQEAEPCNRARAVARAAHTLTYNPSASIAFSLPLHSIRMPQKERERKGWEEVS
jgi:hypothetical protein